MEKEKDINSSEELVAESAEEKATETAEEATAPEAEKPEENAAPEKEDETSKESAPIEPPKAPEEKEPKKKSKKLPIIIIACILGALLIAGAVFGGIALFKGISTGDGDGEGDGGAAGEKTEYSVTVKTKGGMALEGIDVYVYTNDKLEDMSDYAKTDSEGKVSFKLAKSDKYAIVLSGVAKGYDVKESYAFDGEKASIKLSSALITDEDLSTATLKAGDVMYDFTVQSIDGEDITLSEILKDKKMVMLNFWYSTCGPCVSEFPIISDVYEDYKEDIEIIALNNLIMDQTVEAVRAFQNQQKLPFIVATCPSSWSNTFSIQGYPTSVFIDRYGVISVIEVGAVTSKRPWVCAFDHFTAEDYEQKICQSIHEMVTLIKPNVEMPASEEIAATINKGNIDITYRPETEDENAEYIWPFIKAEKLGADCIKASNIGIDDTTTIMYADVTLKAGQALGFDYLISSERLCDVLYVIVDGEDVFQISGVDEKEAWKSCYPLVADKDGTYEVAFCYLKDSDGAEGEDTVYIDNMRVVSSSDIDVDTYLPRYAATTDDDGETYKYVNVVFNETDGYYHVGTADGPLLLADLQDYTPFNEEDYVQNIVYNGEADKDGISLYNKKEDGGLGMVQYFSYASNASLKGICTVNRELAEMLKQVADVAGFDDDPNEWLKMCKYFQAYGPSGKQLEDPIKGLSTSSAYTVTLGKDVSTNYFYYDRAIIPRGTFAKFVPTESGVYRFTSKSDYQDGIDAWIFDGNSNVLLTYEHDERMYTDDINCSMVYYMEAGTAYYINMAFWDVYATGYIYYDVEFIAPSYDLFRLCAPGYFTYDSDATGEEIYDIITGGITPVLRDGKYYSEDGSLIYCDFTGLTPVFSQSILEMIQMGGFDFSKSETDGEILAYLRQNDGDVEKTKEYLEKLWGEDYDANCDLYQIDDIFDGRYHGKGPDLTDDIKAYVDKIDKSGTELDGCVVVDERLAEILQELMDKYTFDDVEHSWLKLCYYYDHLGK
ncbi:MAG: TlpA family protein disulfide reductase [Clostridia bacterium]|nr:TlpA family protein disulfide reductase [Clostridia bacterium]